MVLVEDAASLVIAVLSGIAAALQNEPRYAAYGAILAAVAKALPSIIQKKKEAEA
jgi:hypothetical protein